jgi:hypothetical protein
MRLRNLVADRELPYKVASGIVWDKSGFANVWIKRARRSATTRCAPNKKTHAPPAASLASASPVTRN